jgi:hypothetical protein
MNPTQAETLHARAHATSPRVFGHPTSATR